MVGTAPERPVINVVINVTGNVTAQMDQFYASYLATVRDTESAKLVISRAKTYSARIDLEPKV